MKNTRKMKGFTIIELVAVIAIILIMASMIVPKITSYTQSANNTKYLVDAKVITQAVELYNTDKPTTPISGESFLTEIKSNLTAGSKKYLNSWPKELKIKNAANVCSIVESDKLGEAKYKELLGFIDNPEN